MPRAVIFNGKHIYFPMALKGNSMKLAKMHSLAPFPPVFVFALLDNVFQLKWPNVFPNKFVICFLVIIQTNVNMPYGN
jgi:hypothetical protein